MTTIDARFIIKNLKGEPLKSDGDDLTLGMVIANILLAPHKDKKGFRPLKSYELAKKFYNDATVEIDNADLTQIIELVEETDQVTTLVVAQVLEKLDKAKTQE